jgi:membrane dipeptidase
MADIVPPVPVIDGHNDLAWACRSGREYSVAGLDSEIDAGRTRLQTDVAYRSFVG